MFRKKLLTLSLQRGWQGQSPLPGGLEVSPRIYFLLRGAAGRRSRRPARDPNHLRALIAEWAPVEPTVQRFDIKTRLAQ